MHPRSKHWHLLDYVIVRRCDRRGVHLTRVMRGAECWTDHRLVRSTVRLEIRPPVRKHKPKKKLNVNACQDPSSQHALQQVIADKLSCIPDTDPTVVKDTPSLTADWTLICDSLKEASAETIGFTNRKHQDWFDDNNQQIRDLLQAKNEVHAAKLRNPTSSTLHNNWKELRSKA